MILDGSVDRALDIPGDRLHLLSDLAALALFAAVLALSLGLVAAIFIDLEFMLLPDEITLGGAAIGLLSSPIRHLTWT